MRRLYGTGGTQTAVESDGSLTVTDGAASFTLRNRDFNVRSFRSNLVLRWEWRPGSTLYVVWQQNREESVVRTERVGLGDLFGSLRSTGDDILCDQDDVLVWCEVMSGTGRRRLRRMGTVVPALMILLATRDSLTAQRTAWTFEDLPAGRQPAGFLFASTPTERNGQWSIVRDGTNSVLGQLRQGQSGVQLAVIEGPSFADLVLSVRVRLLEGARSAGVVWRYRDADNYYLARLISESRMSGSTGLWRPTDAVGGEDGLELQADSWNMLKVEHRGTRMRLLINGVPVATRAIARGKRGWRRRALDERSWRCLTICPSRRHPRSGDAATGRTSVLRPTL